MNKPQTQIKPLTGVISAIGETGKVLARWPTTLHTLYADDKLAMLSGILLGAAGRPVAQISISCDPAVLPKSKPVGRPRNDKKKLAVFLAWALEVVCQGGLVVKADKAASDRMSYEASGRKVNEIRQELAGFFNFNTKILEFLWNGLTDPENPIAVFMIPIPQFYLCGAGLKVVGSGYVWNTSQGAMVFKTAIKVISPCWPVGFGPADIDRLNRDHRTLIIVH